ncbi:MAG: metallophosphoesterase [Thermoproteota archaeon]
MGELNMRLLVLSDIVKWEGLEDLVDECKPHVIVLAGDLTSDGFAYSYWFDKFENTEIFKRMPIKPKIEERIEKGVLVVSRESYLENEEFRAFRKKIHVDRFYQFLEGVGKMAKVLVLMGEHDNDFDGDYLPDRINKISGCMEISGRTAVIQGLCFLGLSYKELQSLGTLKRIISMYRGKVDIVVMHGERIRLVSLLKPTLIIRGGYAPGKYLINNVPSVWNSCGTYTTIDINPENKRILEISQYSIDGRTSLSWTLPKKQFKIYRWLKPWI